MRVQAESSQIYEGIKIAGFRVWQRRHLTCTVQSCSPVSESHNLAVPSSPAVATNDDVPLMLPLLLPLLQLLLLPLLQLLLLPLLQLLLLLLVSASHTREA